MNGRWSLLPERASSQLPTATFSKAQNVDGVDGIRSGYERVASAGSRSVSTGGSSTRKGSAAATAHASAVQQEYVSTAADQRSGSNSSMHWLTVGYPDNSINRLRMSQQQMKQLHEGTPATAASCADSGVRQFHVGVVLQPAASNNQQPSVSSSSVSNGQQASVRRSRVSNDQQASVGRSRVSNDQLKYRITHMIKSCVTWQEMAAVVCEHSPDFNHIHVSAAVTHLAQLSRRPHQCSEHQTQQTAQQQHQHNDSVQLVPGLQQLKQQMSQQHRLVGLQHVTRQRMPEQHPSHDHLLQWLLTQAVCQLPVLQSRQVANIMWSLAQLDYQWRASEQAVAAVTALADRATQLLHTAEPQHLANIAYAAAKLHLSVSQDWVQQLQDAWLASAKHCRRQDTQGRQQQWQGSNINAGKCQGGGGATATQLMNPQAVANFMWALAHLQQQPQQAWVQQHLEIVASELQLWPPSSLAVMLWSCVKLGFCFHGQQQQVPASAGITSCALQQQYQVQSSQEADVHALVLHALQQQCQLFTLQDVAQALWAATLMELQLPGPLVQKLLEAGGKQLNCTEAQQPAVALTRRAAAREQAAVVSAAAVAYSVSLVLWSLARQGVTAQYHLPPTYLKPWLTALVAASPAADSQSLALAAWAVCRLRMEGSCLRVLHAMVQAALQQLQQQQPETTSRRAAGNKLVSSRAVASLVWAAGRSIRAAAYSGAAKQTAGCSSQQEYIRQQMHRHSVPAVVAMRLTGRIGTVAADPVAMSPNTDRPSSDQTALQAGVQQLLLSAAGLAGQNSEPQQDCNQQRQQQHITTDVAVPGASLRDLSQILWGVGKMQLPLPAAWWHQCFRQLTHLLQQQHSRPAAQQQFAHSLANMMWGLGLSKVEVPIELIALLQTASSQVLQPNSRALSPQGHVMMLVGMTRICAALAWRLPRRAEERQRKRQRWRQRRSMLKAASVGPQPTVVVSASSIHSAMQEQLHHCSLESDVCSSDDRKLSTAPLFEQQQMPKQGGTMPDWHVQQPGISNRHRWVACAGLQPSWLCQFCVSAGGQLQQLPPTGLVSLIWAFGRLKYHPGCHFLDAALQRLQALLPQCNTRHLSLLMWSLTRLEHTAEDALVQEVLQAWEPLLASASKADTQQIDWALDKVSHPQTSVVIS